MALVQLRDSWSLLKKYYLGLGIPAITLSIWMVWFFLAQNAEHSVDALRMIFTQANESGTLNIAELFQESASFIVRYLGWGFFIFVFLVLIYELLIALTLAIIRNHKAPDHAAAIKKAIKTMPWAILGFVVLGLFIVIWFNINQFLLGSVAIFTIPLGMILAIAIFLISNVVMQDDSLRLFAAISHTVKLWWIRQERYSKTTVILYVVNCILIAYFFLGLVESLEDFLQVWKHQFMDVGTNSLRLTPSIFDHAGIIIEGLAGAFAIIFLVFCSVNIVLLMAKIRLFYSFSRVYHTLGAKKMREEAGQNLEKKNEDEQSENT